MAVWTISAALGAGGREVAEELAAGAFAALRDHPAAVHVRLTAPFGWRVDAYARDELVDHATAERAVRHDDHCKRTWVKTLYGLDLGDPALFALVADASRLPRERLVELLRAAG